MLYVVTGGSGSGKSKYAEDMTVGLHNACCSKDNKLIYVAHMYPYIVDGSSEKRMDDETKDRIERHRNMRADKGFTTKECFFDVASLNKDVAIDKNTVLLGECMSNLLANEMYLDGGCLNEYGSMQVAADKDDVNPRNNTKPSNPYEIIDKYIVDPIIDMADKAYAYVVVTNEIYVDAAMDEETIKYVKYLAYINKKLVEKSDKAYEVCCGIAIPMR